MLRYADTASAATAHTLIPKIRASGRRAAAGFRAFGFRLANIAVSHPRISASRRRGRTLPARAVSHYRPGMR
jgi:hypothetical protein